MISLHGHVERGDLALDLDLDLDTGRTFVVGANGAGKSTLLRVVAGLEALDRGELRIDGTVLDAADRGAFVPTHQRPVAMAFQDHRLFPHLSALDNVAFAARRDGVSRTEARAAAAGHLAAVDATGFAGRTPAELSIGQRQRVAIARALATPATVLLLDEPLAAIDEAGRADIRDLLRAVDHRFVIWVSHDPDDVGADERVISFDGSSVRQTQRS